VPVPGAFLADCFVYPCSIPRYKRVKTYSVKRVTRTSIKTATTIRRSKDLLEPEPATVQE
jgi:hypothetical protein